MKNPSLPLVPMIMSAAAVLIGGAMLCLALVVILRPNQAAEVTPTNEPAETSTNIPTATVAPTNTLTATATVQPTTVQTATPTATATSTNAPTNLPRPTNTPTQTLTPTATVNPYLDSRVKDVSFSITTQNPAVSDEIWFRFKFTNADPNNPIRFVHIGPVVYDSAGNMHWEQWSYSDWEMSAGSTLEWPDWFKVRAVGTFTVKFTICFSSETDCKVMAPPVTITVH